MIQHFNKDMSQLRVYANGAELTSILGKDRKENGERQYTLPETQRELVTVLNDPILVTDKAAHAAIKKQIPRYTVQNLYDTKTKITEFESKHGVTTSLKFRQEIDPKLRGPSYDTILLCQAADMLDLSDTKRAIEPGGGSGFPSKHILNIAPNLEQMDIVDINENALKCWEENIEDERANFIIGDVNEVLGHADNYYDLVISNPPYVPRPNSIDDNPYEGVQMMVNMIENHAQYLTKDGMLLINYSHLCQDHFEQAVARAGMQVEELISREVPFKVTPIMNNKEWFDFLLEQKDLIVKRDRTDHTYRHRITVAKLTPQRQDS